ncbi:MAG: hypothetical protein KGI05_00740 [Thaumarchaeota archaeon]|nr:hypothetical protein [Nitrososphaerota archaeon]
MASINFLNEKINYEKITNRDTKIKGITANPITFHLIVEIEGRNEELDLKVRKDGPSYTVSIMHPTIHGTINRTLHCSNTDLDLAIKDVLGNWEKLLLFGQ